MLTSWKTGHSGSPGRPALLSDGQSFTYGELAARINRYARWALSLGIRTGCTVCLLMPNRPDYLACWLGISRVGGTVALINTRLVGRSLAHCIDLARADHVILAAECVDAFETARPHLDRVPPIWSLGAGGAGADLDAALAAADTRPLPSAERGHVTIDGRALLIYTSGTTGLPKAANVSHRRILSWGGWFAGLTDASVNDRLYDCLPLHHSVGGVAAPCSMLRAGGSVVIAEKFSATNFWDDIVRFDCTVFQYIGELCRYLLKAPASGPRSGHRLRLAVGNGLRGDIWEAFAGRFAIPHILEFYAATEGNFSLFNVEGKPGAIGRIPPLLAHRFPASIVKVDADSGSPVRGEDGLCIVCAHGEVGEAIGRIGAADRGGSPFEGYTDPAETEKKILRDVFAEGDAWFRTGDLMLRDKAGLLPFRRPGRRHVPLEGRERRDQRGERRDQGLLPRRSRCLDLRGCYSRHRRPRRHGGFGRGPRVRFQDLRGTPGAPASGLCASDLRQALPRARRHRDLQAEQTAADPRGI